MTDQEIQQTTIEWKETILGELADNIAYGYTESASEEEIGPKFLRITDIQEDFINWETVPYCQISENDHKKYKLEIGDVVIARTGNSTGAIATIKENVDAVFASYLIRFKINRRKADYRFIDFLLRSNLWKNFVGSVKSGSAQGGANAKAFSSFPILLPSLPEQRAIASVLSAFDDKIELLREQNKTLESIAQTLFNRWFVEFNFPDENGQPYRDSGGKMIDSELGEIPEGWRVGKLGDELEVIMGQSPKGETYNTENDGMEFYQGRADFGERFPTIRLFTTDPMKVAKPMDVLLSVRAPVGEINQTLRKCCIGRGLAAIRSNYKSYTFYRLFNEQEKLKLYEDSGTVFGSITKSAIENIEYIVPFQNIIRQFEEKVHILDQKIFNNHFQIQTLSQLRDSILPKLMRGEVRVKGF
jgi:type I restriction enzyme S subunit